MTDLEALAGWWKKEHTEEKNQKETEKELHEHLSEITKVSLKDYEALQKENAELKKILKHRNCVDCSNHGLQIEVVKLKAQIEKMKNPFNCSNCDLNCHDDCNTCEYWELAE